MGTVHARARDTSDIRRDILDDPLDIDNDTRPSAFKLNGVRARVDRVHVDGLNRTKDDIIRNTVNDMFHATDFEDVLLRAQKVRRALDSMGCFRDIGVFIDVSTGPGSTPEGLEVTFQVRELSRIVGGINTTVSENEGNLVLGAKMPNVLGRGEKLQAEYSMGYRSTSNFSVTATKPFPTKPLVPVVSASVFQQNHEYPWSGYKLLDRGVLLDVAFKTSQYTKHNLQWEGIVRDTSVLSKNTSFKVRESSGPQMKSLIRHIVSIDHRDEPIFPRSGSWVQFSSEVSGLGGGIAYLKSELNAQHNAEISEHVVVQVSGSCGLLHSMFGVGVSERLYLGGAGSVRGFSQRGVGPHDHSHATGGHAFWASGVHIYTPLPFRPGKNGIGELFRSHFFINAGSLAEKENDTVSALEALREVRVSIGAGVALRLGRLARAEVNYCLPVSYRPGDQPQPGIQIGVGAQLL